MLDLGFSETSQNLSSFKELLFSSFHKWEQWKKIKNWWIPSFIYLCISNIIYYKKRSKRSKKDQKGPKNVSKCAYVIYGWSPPLESVLNSTQVKYRKLRSQLAAVRLNTVRLLEICLPDPRLWKQNKWHEKPIETILAEIISGDAKTSLNSPVILLD